MGQVRAVNMAHRAGHLPLWALKATLFLLTAMMIIQAEGQQCNCDSSVPPCGLLRSQDCVKTPRSDCPCCLVCAGQIGDACDVVSQPCDVNLLCDSDSKKCKKGKELILFRFLRRPLQLECHKIREIVKHLEYSVFERFLLKTTTIPNGSPDLHPN